MERRTVQNDTNGSAGQVCSQTLPSDPPYTYSHPHTQILPPPKNCDRLQHLSRWETQDAISMSHSRAAADLSATSAFTSFADRFLQQDRRRTAASLRISITTTTTNHCTPCDLSITASRRPRRRRRQLSRRLNSRQASLLALEAPLKRRRKQVLLLPTSPHHPP
jgi:hypothetical protein